MPNTRILQMQGKIILAYLLNFLLDILCLVNKFLCKQRKTVSDLKHMILAAAGAIVHIGPHVHTLWCTS